MMRTNNTVATKYQQSQVTHADPAQLIVMLYDGALSRLAQARQRFFEKDILQAGLAVTKAQAIIAELRRSLNVEEGGEIAQNLDMLYAYLHDLLVKVTRENRTEPLDEATKLLDQLRGAWAEVARQVKELQEKAQAPQAVLAMSDAGVGTTHLQLKA